MTTERSNIVFYDRELEEGRNYWLARLATDRGASNLISDFETPTPYSYEAGYVEIILPEEMSQKLAKLTGNSQFLIYTTLLTALNICLQRYTGNNQIVIGSPARKNRNGANANANALPIINDVDERLSIKQFLLNVRQTLIDAYSKEAYPYEHLIRDLKLEGIENRCPLFDIALRLEELHSPLPEVKNDITITFSSEKNQPTGIIEFNKRLFAIESIFRFKQHFLHILAQSLENTNELLSNLEALTEAERYQILVEWNDTRRDYPAGLYIHKLFEAQVERTPKNTAIFYENEQLTYEEVNQRANRLAHYLRRLGVGPESFVGICMERSFEMVIAVLGVLKAGGAYVPLDSKYPKERLAFMLEDTNAGIVLAHQQVVDSLPEHRARTIYIDLDWGAISQESSDNPSNHATPDNLAYVIYTSGSAGQPKGVMVSHREVCNSLLYRLDAFELSEADSILQNISFSFDPSIWQIFGALLVGGRLVLARPDGHQDTAYLAGLIAEQQVSITDFAPSTLQVFLSEPLAKECGCLRIIFVGGELLSVELTKRFHSLLGADLYNVYGPTETSIDATFWHCRRGEARSIIPIGRPIGNKQIYILDSNFRPVPVGGAGEIHIAGEGLARGYLNQPDLTAERFLPDPFSARPGARLYKAGDIARHLADGNIQFLGRVDEQVKVRGFRIELGEIESVIRSLPSVQEVVALVREDVPGARLIVAYVVCGPTETVTNVDLRALVRGRLPEHMVPSAFVRLDALPLMPSGKVDRRSLPAPDYSKGDRDIAFEAPRNQIEKTLAEIWSEVLEIEEVGINRDFFELGGHSLLATQVASRVSETFNIELPVRSLFETPTIAALAETIEFKMGASSRRDSSPIVRVPRDGELLLSFAQQRLWFIDQLEPGSPAYNTLGVARFDGALDISALQESIDEIVRRHEVLRTSFPTEDGQPRQVIVPSLHIPIVITDLTRLSIQEQEAEVQRLAAEDSRLPFNLAVGPLLRASLLRLGDRENVFLFTMHHIINDGWSMGILIREVAALYESFSEGLASPLEDLPLQYADYAHWQREWLQGDVLDQQLSYWKHELAGIPLLIELPTDRPRPTVQTSNGAIQGLTLPESLSEAVISLGWRAGATPFMTLLAAFNALLYRYTHQEDIIVGTPIANRNRVETEKLIGLFVNTLVIRTDLSGGPSFQELLAQVRETSLGAYAHQDVPFETVVEALQPQRDMSHTPLFQVMFDLRNTPMPALKFSGLTLTPVSIDGGTAKFDLTFSMEETGQGLIGTVEYNTDLFDASTINRMIEHFKVLLEGAAADPDQCISSLPLLTRAEQRQIIVEWNKTTVDYPTGACVHQLFEEQVERTPDAAAVVFEDEQLTYRELNSRANRLAHYLRKLGVGPEVIVAVFLDRTPNVVIAMLAIWKAGGVYLPLDPSHPRERIAFMFSDARVRVLLTQARIVESLPEHEAEVVCLDSQWGVIAQESDANPANLSAPQGLAYVIYTSGSTGQPKGVLSQHMGLCNLSEAQVHTFDLKPDDRVIQFSPFTFDASIFEMVMALRAGAALYITSRESLIPGPHFIRLMEEKNITSITIPPSVLAASPSKDLPALRTVIVAGEACPPGLVERWAAGRRFFNAYGPTETTVCATVAECSDPNRIPPIGRPIANAQVYLLDRDLQPVPVMLPGELHIGGAGVARGYLNRPDLTAERFIPNPFTVEPGDRLYKSGDLARYLPDGNIEYIGRTDFQVKIRGFRVELGEIEAALSRHPAVSNALVTAHDHSAGVKRLVAYVVHDEAQSITSSELRAFAAQTLPDYMIPSVFIMLGALPLTLTGKIDLRALPPPDDARPELGNELVLPRTQVEETLAHIFGQVLGLKQVGINDNFFELGGDSILSIQVIARANKAGLRLTPRQLFQNQAIAQLAKVASIARVSRADDSFVTGPVPLTPIQRWFFEQDLPEPDHYNQAVLLEARKPLELTLIEASVRELLRHHDALRLRFEPSESGWQQFNGDESEGVPFVTEDFSNAPEEEQKILIEAAATEWQASLNISSGPLIRVVHMNLGTDRPSRLFIVIHHLAVDMVSWRILLDDLQTIYNQLEQGQKPELAPKTTSFKLWAERLAEYARSERLQEERAYWLTKAEIELAGLPVDVPGAANTALASSNLIVALTEDETRALVQELPSIFHTHINDVLLTALAQAFHKWARIRSLLINLEGHGREELFADVDVSRTVGWFTTIFPVRLELSQNANPADTLKSIKEVLRRIPQRGIGYGLLRYLSNEIRNDEGLRPFAEPQVSFNYLGQFDQAISESSLFKLAQESTGQAQSQRGNLHHLIDINAMITNGRLQIKWTYSENVYNRPTIERLANEFIIALRSLIAYSRESEVSFYTPSDFPLARLDQQELDSLIKPGRQIENLYPLSPLQQGMLFHTLYSPESEVYFEQMSGTFHGPFDVNAFKRAWHSILSRHSILRTSFAWEGLDEPVQIVHKEVRLPFEKLDWSNLSASEQKGRLEGFLSADRDHRFELSAAPLMRLIIIKLSDDSHRFIWSHHHLLIDGWSMPLIFKEALALYQAFRSGTELRLEQPTPYAEYIAWLCDQDLTKAEAFWRRTLEGFTAPTPLVVDRFGQASLAGEAYGDVVSRLPETTTSTLNVVSRQNQLTLSTLVQGAWALLLGRYGGEEDVVFGATVSGRPPSLEGVESMVGLFINTIPVRAQISPHASVRDWLRVIQEQQVEARQFEFSPLVQVQGWSRVPRGLPLFESLLVFENYPIDTSLQSHTASLGISDIQFYERTNYPLAITALPGKELMIQIDYDCGRFDESSINRMIGHLESLLEGMAADPSRPVSELPLLKEAEHRQMLFDWNEIELTTNRSECIHELFEAQVERTPYATALVYEGEKLTYKEFNRRANNLAHHLRSLGIGPDVPVGFCLHRSLEMMICIMGILKAGGAYVPLDPAYPKERLSFMLDDSRMSVLLTQQKLVEVLPDHAASMICLDSDWGRIDCGNDDNLRSGVGADNLAYIIYTSGSTGKPKGVMIEHRSLVSYTNTAAERYEVGPDDRFLQFCSISFDISGEEIYPSLTRGAALVLRTESMLDSVSTYLQKSDEWGLTVMSLPTAYWHEIAARLEEDDLSLPPSLRLVIVAGDRILPERLATWHKHTKGRPRLINTYGPTEATISVSMCELTEALSSGGSLREALIGKVIADAQIYVLDRHLQPVPVGVPGELYIGGLLVGRGYFNRPELTAIKFVPHPFGKEPGARLYKSEDIAFYMPDGSLQFVGRVDHQIKIRGFRVELEEIDSALCQHSNIRETVVIAREDVPGNKRIIAYVVAKQAPAPSNSELRLYLKDKLPDFMIPSAFVMLEALPLTVNGKVDRHALPSPDSVNRDLEESFKAPRTPVEDIIAGIWLQSLGVRQVGIDDNFFELGGHSLLATQVVSRLRNAFNVDVPLRLLFETATLAALAERIETQIRAGQSFKAHAIQPIADKANTPLSFTQQRFWFIDQFEANTSTYNIPAAVRLIGRLDKEALEQTFNEIIRRHEILRTTFSSHEGQPVQVIAPAQSQPLLIEDLRSSSDAELEGQALRIAAEEAQKPFDLARGPLIRAKLLRLGDVDHVFLFTMHHIVSDGWSIVVLLREVAALYEAFSAGRPSPLDPLPIQYADFACWQREWLQGEALEAQLDYWRQKLAGAPPSLDLPTDRPRPEFMSAEGSTESLIFSGRLSDSLKAFSRREGVTLFMTLLAGLNVLLRRYTGQNDIVIGSPIANRNRTEIEGLIGPFVNTLALRTELSCDISFKDLLQRVKETSLQAYTHQDLPFEKLVEDIKPERDLSRSPLFQVVFAFESESAAKPQLPGLKLEAFGSEKGTAKFELTFFITEKAEGLSATVEYNKSLFDSATITRMLCHFETLLAGASEDPRREVISLPMMSEEEKRQLLEEWNDTGREYPKEGVIHGLFEEEARRRWEEVAVVSEQERLSYGELNKRANQIAHYLLKQDVRIDEVVGLMMERGPELIATLLAILKAGAAYLPLSPDYPQERVKYAISDAGASLVIIQERLKHKLVGVDVRVISLEEVTAEISEQSEDDLNISVDAQNLAYVIYTSGSTGRPKGIGITHRSVARLVKETDYVRMNEGEVFLQLAPVSFDASTFEIWGSLLNGARLAIMQAHPPTLEELGESIKRYGVTTLWLTAGLFNLMVDERIEDLKPVKQLLVGGDVLSVPHVERFLRSAPEPKLINGYGPTESTTFTCCYEMSEPALNVASIPIGRPIANTQVYILDERLEAVPVGVVGDLYIGGDGLARGYMSRADWTAEMFLPNPFCREKGGRLYNTGDLARYLADGTIEFHGRRDNQVKIRGFRIELAEIESVLAQHSMVRQVVVVARQEEGGEKNIFAYIVPADGQEIGDASLRSYLENRLPDYMRPAAFVFLEQLPLTPNGKVDRRALPAPDWNLDDSAASLRPRTVIQQIVAAIWSEILKLDRVGIESSFFELGGHSLLATQLISRVRETFNVEMPLRKVFESPTVKGMALSIEAMRGTMTGIQVPPVEMVPRDEELPLSFAQQRLWFLDQLEPGSSFYNIPFAMRLVGTLDVEALERSLNEVVDRHEVLRTIFVKMDSKIVQKIEKERSAKLIIIDLSKIDEEERQRRADELSAEEAATPFDLGRGPLLRTTLLKLSDEEHMLLSTMHHIISDGWSMEVLVREIAALYEAFSSGNPSPLSDLPIQYADYAYWQRQWVRGEVLEVQLEYWKRQLGDAPSVLQLPTDRPRPAVQTFAGATIALPLSRAVTEELIRLSNREGVTLFMTMLAAFQTLLYRYTGQEDISVGTPIAGRNRLETEGLIGLFVNTLVMRMVLSPRLSFSELLRQVRDIVLDGDAHQEIPFEKLVEELGVERSLSWTPVFQVLMALQNASRFTFELPGLKIIPLTVDNNTSKFDLSMFLIESPEGLSAAVEYNTDLFDPTTIMRMLRHFQALLAAASQDPRREVMSLPMLSEEEKRQLLEEWNETAREYPKEALIQGLFEEEVRRRGEAVAVVNGREQITYDELNKRANQIANHLLSIGVHIEQRIGICVERSVDMVAGLLAILKAGAVYVPMDPNYPKERLAFILEDAGLSVILVQQGVIDKLPEHSARLVSLDTGWEAIARASEDNPETSVVSENLSYIIYTSGSTGRPKGVAIEHHNVVAMLDWARETFSSEELSSVLASTSICFDLSVFELFAPLSTGGKVILAENALRLPELPAAGEVKLLNTVPSAMSELIRVNGVPSSVITASLAGEALPGALVRQIFEYTAVGRVFNLYGPSEDTTYSTGTSLYRETSGEPTIGSPISNTQVYILDNWLQPVPQGVVGEIYISGEGLSRGYLNRPEMTAEKYLPNPFSKEPGGRFYKTGDLARYLPDSSIEFHGRVDHQVKIRGFRIELGEIEAVLAHHPKVRDVVALVREDVIGDKRLITYLVAKEGEELISRELSGFLQQRLPSYMQPSAFVVLDSLPLTPNGKVDRKALPAPDNSDARQAGAYKAPRSHVEEVLALLWGQVLGVEGVGVEDSFFELGGHSLLAAQLVSRVREAFKLEMPLRRIFEAPTIAQMAETVEALRKAEEGLIVPPITRDPRNDRSILSFAQQRLWFIDRLESGSAFYNIPAAVRLEGSLNTEALEQSFNEIVRRHESLRTTFSDSGGTPAQIIAPSLNLALPIFDLRDLSEDERASRTRELISEESWRPFDLTRGPLIRASLLRIDEQEHILTICMHHIISDGWSIGVFIDEMARLYGAYSEGKASPLPELMIQYRDYALWQRQWLKGEVLEAEIGYWKKQLEGAPTAIEIKTDGARPAAQTYEGRSASIEIGEEAVRRLKEVGGRQGATMYMVMAAAMEVLMYRYSGQEDMVIGTPVANRVRQETEPLIGCFINVLALRAKLSNNPTYNEMLRQAREVILDALTHQDLPFEKLVEALQIERDPSRSPLFQVMFALQSARNTEIELPGLTLTPMDEENKAAHFDLNMAVQEEGQSMSATLTYNIDLFNAETVTQMLSDYKLILEEVSLNPEVTLKELVETLTQVEKQKSDEKQKAFKESSIKKLRKLRRKAFD